MSGAGLSPLPPQWTEHKDPNGRQYYFNTVTKVTSWKRPQAADEGQPTAAPTAWTQLTDDKGRVYYYNKQTKETSWKKPLDEQPQASGASVTPEPTSAQQGANNSIQSAVENKAHEGLSQQSGSNDTLASKAQSSTVAAGVDVSLSPAKDELPQVSSSPRPTPSPSLPAAWTQLTDDKGRVYYYNKQTKETSWKKPLDEQLQTNNAASNESKQGLPQQPIPVSNSVAEKPVASTQNGGKLQNIDVSATRNELPGVGSSPRPTTSPSLPAAWTQLTDDKGRVYYYNKQTKETSWKRPDDEIPVKPIEGGTLQTSGSSSGKLSELDAAGAAKRVTMATAPASVPQQKTSVLDQPISPWNMRIDYRTGQQMWVNTNTGEVSWSDPSAVQAELLLPISAETLFCFGGNERPSRQELLEAGYISGPLSTVEMFDGKSWLTLQNSCADVHRHKNVRQLPRQPLPVDFESVCAVRIGRSDCLLFGFVRVVVSLETMSEVRHPTCLQWSSDTFDLIVRSDLTSVLLRQHGSSFAGVPNAVVATGGFLDDTMKSVSTDAWLCDVRNSSCNVLPPLNFARASHTMAIVDLSNTERLLWFAFVFGGFDGERKSASVERYTLGGNRWEVMNDMPQARTGHCAVAVDRTIFVIGGRGRYKVLNDVDTMHVQSDSWKKVKPMNQARANFSAVYLSPFVIVVGGWDGANFLNTVEAYDPRIDVWRKVCSLPRPKQHMGVVVLRKVQDESTKPEEPSLRVSGGV